MNENSVPETHIWDTEYCESVYGSFYDSLEVEPVYTEELNDIWIVLGEKANISEDKEYLDWIIEFLNYQQDIDQLTAALPMPIEEINDFYEQIYLRI